MKRTRLIRAASLAALLGASAIAIALLAQTRFAQAQARQREALVQHTALAQRLRQTLAEQEKEALLAVQRERFARLDAGAPLWTDRIAQLQRQPGFAGVELALTAPAGGLIVTQLLQFDARVRHEGEFLELLTALQTGATVRPRRCALARLPDDAGLSVRCTLERVALRGAVKP